MIMRFLKSPTRLTDSSRPLDGNPIYCSYGLVEAGHVVQERIDACVYLFFVDFRRALKVFWT